MIIEPISGVQRARSVLKAVLLWLRHASAKPDSCQHQYDYHQKPTKIMGRALYDIKGLLISSH
nr:hypothetical protein [Moraxella ovis]